MSSLRNAAKSQKTHRERRQPELRSSLGLLEKKKDYKLRAKDYNEKRKTLKKLRKKALDRNPDEFYFHMLNSRTEDGVHKEMQQRRIKKKTRKNRRRDPEDCDVFDEGEALTPEQAKLMQSQDLRYIVYKRTLEKNKIHRLVESAPLLLLQQAVAAAPEGTGVADGPMLEGPDGDRPRRTHTFFVDTEEELKRFDPAAALDTHPALLDRVHNRPRKADLKSGRLLEALKSPVDAKAMEKGRRKVCKELLQRVERERHLGVIQEKMEAKMSLANKKKLKPISVIKEETKTSAPVFKWANERKR